MRVVIAEDMPIVRAGLRLLLESADDMEVVGEASTGSEVLDLIPRVRPDVVLMDITMPEMDGLEATKRIRERHGDLPILVLTMHEDRHLFFRLLEAGANGYLVKGAAPGDLVQAVRAVSSGGAYLYPSLAQCLVEEYRAPVHPKVQRTNPLTDREMEVLRLTAQGMTAKQIGKSLFISKNTVARHRANIMAKLELSNRAELIRYAVERNLIGAE